MNPGRMNLGMVEAGHYLLENVYLAGNFTILLKIPPPACPSPSPSFYHPPPPPAAPLPAIPGFFSDRCFRTLSFYQALAELMLGTFAACRCHLQEVSPFLLIQSNFLTYFLLFSSLHLFLFEVLFVVFSRDRTAWILVTTGKIPNGTSREGMFALAFVLEKPVCA